MDAPLPRKKKVKTSTPDHDHTKDMRTSSVHPDASASNNTAHSASSEQQLTPVNEDDDEEEQEQQESPPRRRRRTTAAGATSSTSTSTRITTTTDWYGADDQQTHRDTTKEEEEVVTKDSGGSSVSSPPATPPPYQKQQQNGRQELVLEHQTEDEQLNVTTGVEITTRNKILDEKHATDHHKNGSPADHFISTLPPPTSSTTAAAAAAGGGGAARGGTAAVLLPAETRTPATTNNNKKDEERETGEENHQKPLMVQTADEQGNTNYDTSATMLVDATLRPTTALAAAAAAEESIAGDVLVVEGEQGAPNHHHYHQQQQLVPEVMKKNNKNTARPKAIQTDGPEQLGDEEESEPPASYICTETIARNGTTRSQVASYDDSSNHRHNLMTPAPDNDQSDAITSTNSKEDEEVVSINVSLAQRKMMRFFFGDTAADEIAKIDMNHQAAAAMNEKKSATKDASRRMYIRFPHKLMYTLECGDYNNILSWNSNGSSFKIEDRDLFEMKVLPEIFKDAKFSSFRRKLNRWYFKRHRSEKVFTVSHPYFRRGNYSLCDMMACGDSKQCDLQPNLESIPPAFLGQQEVYHQERSMPMAPHHSVLLDISQPATATNVENYSNYQHGHGSNASFSGFPPTMVMPPRIDPVTGLIFQQQTIIPGRNDLQNDHGTSTMLPNIMVPSRLLDGTPNASGMALQNTYSSVFNNGMGVRDLSISGIPISSGQSLARNDGRAFLNESAFQVIHPGNQVLSSNGYLPPQTLHPEYVMSDGMISNYFGAPQMSNLGINYGMHAGFVDSQPRISAGQTVVPPYTISLPAPTGHNIGGGHNVEFYLPATNSLHTVGMPPFAMTGLSQQEQSLNSEQRRLQGTNDKYKDANTSDASAK